MTILHNSTIKYNIFSELLTYDVDLCLPCDPGSSPPVLHAHLAGVGAGVAVARPQQAQRAVPKVVVQEGHASALDRPGMKKIAL